MAVLLIHSTNVFSVLYNCLAVNRFTKRLSPTNIVTLVEMIHHFNHDMIVFFVSYHLQSPQWSSMVIRHRLLSSAIFLSSPIISRCLSTASFHIILISFQSHHFQVSIHSILSHHPYFFPVPSFPGVYPQHPFTSSSVLPFIRVANGPSSAYTHVPDLLV